MGYDKQLFNSTHKKLLNWCLDNCVVFEGDSPTPTNWDYSQNNWMVDEKGVLTGIIDFENTLWGLPFDSFGVILERYTYDKPLLRASFMDGYGLPENHETDVKMKILSAKIAFADVNAGYAQNNSRFFECGNRTLSRLIESV